MYLSNKSRYAIMAMMELSLDKGSNPISLQKISKKLGISISYLEQLVFKLRKQGLIKGQRGPGGGYVLDALAGEISIADIVEAINGDRRNDGIVDKEYRTSLLWVDLNNYIGALLRGITLEDVIRSPELRNISGLDSHNHQTSPGVTTKAA